MPNPKLGLSAILTVSMISIILVVVVLTTLLNINHNRSIFRTELERRGLMLADALTGVIARDVYLSNVNGLNTVTRQVADSHSDLTGIHVFNAEGRLLAGVPNAGPDSGFTPVLPPEIETGYPGGSFHFKGDRLEVYRPLVLEAEQVGLLRISFGAEALHSSIRLMVQKNILQGAWLVVLGLVLAYVIAHRVTNPLKTLSASALSMGRGDLESQMPVPGAREISLLGETLDLMRLELRQLYSGLEQQVAQRTGELTLANRDLAGEIFEREVAEEELRQSESRFRQLSEAAIEAVVITQDGKIVEINPGFTAMLGFEGEEVMGKSVLDLVPHESKEEVRQRMREAGDLGPFEGLGLKKDGGQIVLQISRKTIKYRGRDARVLALWDITGHKMMEEALRQGNQAMEDMYLNLEDRVRQRTLELQETNRQLVQAQDSLVRSERLAAVGQLAGGVAHDLRNPLGAVSNAVY